jgi:hypothetical protein
MAEIRQWRNIAHFRERPGHAGPAKRIRDFPMARCASGGINVTGFGGSR